MAKGITKTTSGSGIAVEGLNETIFGLRELDKGGEVRKALRELHKEISKEADEEFYKPRPLLKLVLNIYFLPYNLLRLVRYVRIRHDYEKNEIEMKVLNNQLNKFGKK